MKTILNFIYPLILIKSYNFNISGVGKSGTMAFWS